MHKQRPQTANTGGRADGAKIGTPVEGTMDNQSIGNMPDNANYDRLATEFERNRNEMMAGHQQNVGQIRSEYGGPGTSAGFISQAQQHE